VDPNRSGIDEPASSVAAVMRCGVGLSQAFGRGTYGLSLPRPTKGCDSVRRVYRITTFVPPDHVDAVLEGVEREVPLVFGPYDRSAWWSAVGTEQFRPLPGSAPTVGKLGQVERVPSVRLEFAIPRQPALLKRVLTRGVLANHPWQEPAVFIDEALATATALAESDSPSDL
jgi:hypothetical protein